MNILHKIKRILLRIVLAIKSSNSVPPNVNKLSDIDKKIINIIKHNLVTTNIYYKDDIIILSNEDISILIKDRHVSIYNKFLSKEYITTINISQTGLEYICFIIDKRKQINFNKAYSIFFKTNNNNIDYILNKQNKQNNI